MHCGWVSLGLVISRLRDLLRLRTPRKGGLQYGRTDDQGYEAIENKMHIHDWHATILHLLGLDHEQLTYSYAGREMRLTDLAGSVAFDVIS